MSLKGRKEMENTRKLQESLKGVLVGLGGAVFVLTMLAFFVPSAEAAAVSGVCSNCHTMHNSQNAGPMRLGSSDDTGITPLDECQECHGAERRALLRYGCYGCHGEAPESTSDIASVGSVGNVPQVFHTDSVTPLAGGSFSYVLLGGQKKGHNVHGLVGIGQDALLLNNPPGYIDAFNPVASYDVNYSNPGNAAARTIFCAGTQGCHGDRSKISQTAAMKGTHHADDSEWQVNNPSATTANMCDPTTGLPGYRMLAWVKGLEDPDWEDTNSPSDHNVYLAKNQAASGRTAAGQATSDLYSMSAFCAQCHGDFHAVAAGAGAGITTSTTDTDSWIRHPTDVAMPATMPYSSYASYNVETPVALIATSATGGSPINNVNSGYAVFCLSCHRAHADFNDDAMRYDMRDSILNLEMVAGQTDSTYKDTGCFRCHSDKDAP